VFLGSLYAVLVGMNRASADVRIERQQINAAVLREAREALIAFAAAQASQGPGHLPCPDKLDTGTSPGILCGTPLTPPNLSRVGRLPWRTLGLPDLRDGSGERLWYAVSDNFLNKPGRPVNSDVQGQLTVVGTTAPTPNVIAVIFAPGGAVTRADGTLQQRPPAGACGALGDPRCDPVNYLERENADGDENVFVAAPLCIANLRNCGTDFNDELVVITHEDLFAAVETVVARRLETEVGKELAGHFQAWQAATGTGFYPFAVPFDAVPATIPAASPPTPDPYRNAFLGRLAQTAGLFPVTALEADDDPNALGWITAAWTSVQTGGTGAIESFSCTSDPYGDRSRAQCTLGYSGTLQARITGRAQNVTKSVARPIYTGSLTGAGYASTYPVPLDPLDATPRLTTSPIPAATGPVFSATVTQALDFASGALVVNVDVVLDAAAAPPPVFPATFPTVTVEIPTPRLGPLFTSSDYDWIYQNYWFSQFYYTVHPQFAAFAAPKPVPVAATCAPQLMGPPVIPATPCITLQTGSATPQTDIAAMAVLAGRPLGTRSRPWTFTRYYEDQNRTLSPPTVIFDPSDPAEIDYTYEMKPRAPAFNDRAAVLARRP
jgi:hypothetical protein